MTDVFASSVCGRWGAVFEYDGETAYFYLHDMEKPVEKRVVGHVHIFSGPAPLAEEEVVIKWNSSEDVVGLFIEHKLIAVFDLGSATGMKVNWADPFVLGEYGFA